MASGFCMSPRRFLVATVLIIAFSLAFNPSLARTQGVAQASGYRELMLKSRHVSPFVRWQLEAGYNASAGAMAARPYQSAGMSSGYNRYRRLAGPANCSDTPGTCSAATFAPGSVCCAATGICVDLKTDRANCGICAYSCPPSLGCCDGTCVSTLTDNFNCGTCGTTCTRSLCSGGMCGYGG